MEVECCSKVLLVLQPGLYLIMAKADKQEYKRGVSS